MHMCRCLLLLLLLARPACHEVGALLYIFLPQSLKLFLVSVSGFMEFVEGRGGGELIMLTVY